MKFKIGNFPLHSLTKQGEDPNEQLKPWENSEEMSSKEILDRLRHHGMTAEEVEEAELRKFLSRPELDLSPEKREELLRKWQQEGGHVYVDPNTGEVKMESPPSLWDRFVEKAWQRPIADRVSRFFGGTPERDRFVESGLGNQELQEAVRNRGSREAREIYRQLGGADQAEIAELHLKALSDPESPEAEAFRLYKQQGNKLPGGLEWPSELNGSSGDAGSVGQTPMPPSDAQMAVHRTAQPPGARRASPATFMSQGQFNAMNDPAAADAWREKYITGPTDDSDDDEIFRYHGRPEHMWHLLSEEERAAAEKAKQEWVEEREAAKTKKDDSQQQYANGDDQESGMRPVFADARDLYGFPAMTQRSQRPQQAQAAQRPAGQQPNTRNLMYTPRPVRQTPTQQQPSRNQAFSGPGWTPTMPSSDIAKMHGIEPERQQVRQMFQNMNNKGTGTKTQVGQTAMPDPYNEAYRTPATEQFFGKQTPKLPKPEEPPKPGETKIPQQA